MGGWMALELAKRGRAQTVCTFSPAGFWEQDWPDRERSFKLLLAARRDARRGRRIGPFLGRSARFRRWAMRDACVHGDRITREQFIFASEDVIGCEIAEELIKPGSDLAAFEAPCPVTIAWAAEDRIFPLSIYEERGRTLVGGADFLVLDDVGHVPMYDDPQLIADTILAVTQGSSAVPSAPGP
jgi:pimeloyl-ACP methyl ester carboxylesterase